MLDTICDTSQPVAPKSCVSYSPNQFLSVHALERLEGHVRVDETVLRPIVFVGMTSREGRFIAHGTGFITANFIKEKGFQSIVTARHVIERINSNMVQIRINTRRGDAEILSAPKSDWCFHPDDRVDVAVCPSVLLKEQFDILHMPLAGPTILNDEIIKDRDIGLGDEVFVSGMYVSRLGETRNIPIARVGTIAAMADEKLETEYGYHSAYLIEVRSIDGLSGSPVFVHLNLWQVKDGQPKMRSGTAQFLMGMILGHASVGNPNDTIEIRQQSERETEAAAALARVPWNTGIAVVLPIQYVIEAVEQPKIHDRRVATINKERDRNFVADGKAGT